MPDYDPWTAARDFAGQMQHDGDRQAMAALVSAIPLVITFARKRRKAAPAPRAVVPADPCPVTGCVCAAHPGSAWHMDGLYRQWEAI